MSNDIKFSNKSKVVGLLIIDRDGNRSVVMSKQLIAQPDNEKNKSAQLKLLKAQVDNAFNFYAVAKS